MLINKQIILSKNVYHIKNYEINELIRDIFDEFLLILIAETIKS